MVEAAVALLQLSRPCLGQEPWLTLADPERAPTSVWWFRRLGFESHKADVKTLCSNHWDLPSTPDELRKLAEVGGRDDGSSEPISYRSHELSKRLGGEMVDVLVRRAQAGESVQSLAREVGVAHSALTRMLRAQGVTIQRRKVGEEEERALAKAYEAGHTIAELEESFRMSHGAVLRALHRAAS